MSYAIDVDRSERLHERIGKLIEETFSLRSVFLGYGHYAGLVEIGAGKLLALHSDGVGTKVRVAQRLNRYDTIGIDCVAMNVNDLICLGAEPISLVVYLAMQELDEGIALEITRGLVKGAKEAGVAIVGGETAIMPDVIKGFDLAAMSLGLVDREDVVTGEEVEVGDAVIGMASSGIHSNGLTLARGVLGEGEGELLVPTKIYVKEVLDILSRVDVHGMGHITGGAFSKLRRIVKFKDRDKGIYLDSMPDPPEIFKRLKKKGDISEREMYRTFNMGIGFCLVVSPDYADEVVEISRSHGTPAVRIGEVVKERGIKVRGGQGDIWIERW
jgi:phosphoribosylformylglycinamidine cyclo-ligase